jgi:hypothetical protein
MKLLTVFDRPFHGLQMQNGELFGSGRLFQFV